MANLILTMAGKYSRFKNEGYKIPKYLLPWGSRTILSEILYEMLRSGAFESVFLVANKADVDYMGHIKNIMKYHGIDAHNLIAISDTKGQAATASIGLKEISKIAKLQGAIVFHNIDTIPYQRDFKLMETSLKTNNGYIDIFQSNNHDYSYVIDNNGKIEAIGEKILISNLATSGLYGFSSQKIFEENYDGQDYISDVYKTMLDKKLSIAASPVNSELHTIVLGTPEEYLRCSRAIKVQ